MSENFHLCFCKTRISVSHDWTVTVHRTQTNKQKSQYQPHSPLVSVLQEGRPVFLKLELLVFERHRRLPRPLLVSLLPLRAPQAGCPAVLGRTFYARGYGCAACEKDKKEKRKQQERTRKRRKRTPYELVRVCHVWERVRTAQTGVWYLEKSKNKKISR